MMGLDLLIIIIIIIIIKIVHKVHIKQEKRKENVKVSITQLQSSHCVHKIM